MNRIFFVIFIFVFEFSNYLYGEEKTKFPFNYVDVPDSISSVLVKAYGNAECNAEHNVRNMTIRNDVEFQDGIYVFNGMGPHFKHMLFIFKKRIYIFEQPIEYAAIDDMLVELSECKDSLKLTEDEMSLYKRVIISAIKKNKLFVEDVSNKKIKISSPYPTDVIDGAWFIQIKCLKKHKKKYWIRLYDSYFTFQQVNPNILRIKEGICTDNNKNITPISQLVSEQKECLYKIVNLFRSKNKFYMTISRKTGKNEYELYYLSKNNK